MNTTRSERRLLENEAVFRRHNERVQAQLARFKQMAERDGHHSLVQRDDLPLHFFCECSDENCAKRIVMASDAYRKIHANRRQFIILPGHEVCSVERVVSSQPEYAVVEKFDRPSEDVAELQPTDVKNT